MIRFIYNGKYRTRSVTIRSFLNGQEMTENGFPVVEQISQEFPGFNRLNDQQLMGLTDIEYSSRIEAFKTFLLGKYSFLSLGNFVNVSFGQDGTLCAPGTIVSQSVIEITPDTEITIFFDSSGSMNSTLTPLTTMRNTLLKSALLPFYGNNVSLYDQKVKVISDPSERTFYQLANRTVGLTGDQLFLVFQDEAQPVYHANTSIEPRTATFNSDLSLLRSRVEALPVNSYRGIVFQVVRNTNDGQSFRSLIKAVENGTGEYSGENGLSDKTEFAYEYDVISGSTPQYYMDLVLIKMRELGYRI